MGAVVMIECPRLLFPFARQIIADAVRNGGFPPLYIDPIDFGALYMQRMQQQGQPARPWREAAARGSGGKRSRIFFKRLKSSRAAVRIFDS